jgi:hypothetical protein
LGLLFRPLFGFAGNRDKGFPDMRLPAAQVARASAAVFLLAALAACSAGNFGGSGPEQQANAVPPPPPPPPPPPLAPAPPPVDLAGRWKLTAAQAGACFMSFGNTPATVAAGTIAPEGGCPGSFFTSRKWTFEHGVLFVRNHKSEPLAQLSFADGRFEGHDTSGAAVSLTR